MKGAESIRTSAPSARPPRSNGAILRANFPTVRALSFPQSPRPSALSIDQHGYYVVNAHGRADIYAFEETPMCGQTGEGC